MATIADVLAYAKQQLGKTYVFGAAGPSTFDCSGLMQYVWHHFGVNLPRTSEEQAKVGASVPFNQIQPGDLVFSNWGDGPNSHVGMAVGGGQIIDAPHTGAVVRYDTLTQGYMSHVTAVRRLTGDTPNVVPGDRNTDNGQAPGTGDSSGFWGPILQPFQDMATAAHDISAFTNLLTKAFIPSNFVRITAGISGAVFILFGILMLTREVRPK